MRLTATTQRHSNCKLDAPNFGVADIVVETVGYGMSIVSDSAEARRVRSYYPVVRTSGEWYVEAVFSSVEERDDLHRWLLEYVVEVMDQWSQPLPPITVTVPSEDFMKVGYPKSSIEFGDEFGKGVYRSIITFASASDPLLAADVESVYIPPKSDKAALHFYPAGIQSVNLPPPAPPVVWSGADKSPYDDPEAATVTRIRDWLTPF